MATNENTYQIHDFSNGMDTDTSDALISNKSYRMAKNLRYITDVDENTGELRLIEGAKFIDALSEDIEMERGVGGLKILAFNSIRNVGAIICENDARHWVVCRMEYVDNALRFFKVFGWCTTPLGDPEAGLTTKISTVLKWEDPTRLQLYIADGDNPLMKINLYDTANSSDIKYVSTAKQQTTLHGIEINNVLNGGSLVAGLVQYTYRLYNKNNVSTRVSVVSKLASIQNTNITAGAIGLESQEVSQIGLQIKVSVDNDVQSTYDRIQIYRISYVQQGQIPTISLIYDGKYELIDGAFLYSDVGTTDLQKITLEEFNSISGITIKPKVIEQKNNILFAGNISYETDDLDEELLKADFRAFSSGDGVSLNNIPSQNVQNRNLDLSKEYDITSWYDIADGRTSQIGGTGKYITWRLKTKEAVAELMSYPKNRYSDHDQLKTINGTRDPKYSVRGLAHDEIYRYGIILYSKSGIKYPVKWVVDIRTPKLESNPKSLYQQLSTIDNSNNADVKVEASVMMYPEFALTQNIKDKISGYEIVRVIRHAQDMATISQGIISAAVKANGQNHFCSSGMPFVDHALYFEAERRSEADQRFYAVFGEVDEETGERKNTIAETSINVLQFYSPETAYNQNDLVQLMNSNKNLYLQVLYPVVPTLSSEINDFEDFVVDTKNVYKDGKTLYDVRYNSSSGSFDSIRLTSSMYGDSDIQYKYFSFYYGYTRYKWYDSKLDQRLFNKATALSDSEFSRDKILKDLHGLNVYKLHPITSMPSRIHMIPIDPGLPARTEFKISDYGIVDAVDWNDLITNESFNGRNYQTSIAEGSSYHCVAPYIIADNDGVFDFNQLKISANGNRFRDELIATCDPSLVLLCDNIADINSIVNFYHRDLDIGRGDNYNKGQIEYSLLCNIRRNIIPYGGFDKQARENSIYAQHGCYTDKIDPLTYMEADDGDVVVSAFEFVTAHKWDSALRKSDRATVVCQTVVESTIDIRLDAGEKYSNNTKSNPSLVQVNPCNFNDEYIQKKPAYVYNTAYSIDPQLSIQSNNYTTIEESINNFDHRVHYSNPSSDNQALDPWLVFQPLNYLDVDSRYGPITNLRSFKNELIFWQEKACGILSVNERVQIATESNTPLMLGTGGVLDRFDYLTVGNGMKENQHADTQSENTLYWWDYDNNTICEYTRGSTPVQLSKVKSVQNILNKSSKEGALISGGIYSSDWPLLSYDDKYNEVLFTIGTIEGGSLVYNEQQQRFASVYDIDPQCYFNIKQNLMFMRGDRVYGWNSNTNSKAIGFDNTQLKPYLKYVVNKHSDTVKVYDNVEFAGVIPNSDTWNENSDSASTLANDIKFDFATPLKQYGHIDGTKITNRQLDFKFAIPRAGDSEYGDRMRGKTMQCEMKSDSNSLNFSLQYILTKYRISWG